MDGGSSSLPLSPPPPPQVYLRRPMPPPGPAPPPKVHFFRPPAPIPIFTARGPGPRAAPKPPMPPPASQAPPLPQPPPPDPTVNQQLPPRPPQPPPAAAAMRPPRHPQPPSAAVAMRSPPPPQAVANGQQGATPPFNDGNNEREISRAGVKEETAQGHGEESTTAPVKVIKRAKIKASKQTMDASNGGAVEGDSGLLYSSNHCRYDSSLSLLTKKFISLLEGAEDGTIDLNKAAEMLEVQKRRIYDITNVLEGVDLIEKTLKNMIRWKGFDISKPKEKERQISALKEELDSLYNEDDRLENEIREAQEKLDTLTLDEETRKFLYVLKDDINKIPRFKDSTLIAINAPRGTSIEVPDPDVDLYFFGNLDLTEEHYQMVLRSSMGPIDCYLISDRQEIFNSYDQVTPDSSEPVVTNGSAQVLRHMGCDPNRYVQQMDCDQNETVQQMDCDPSQALKGEGNAICTNTTAPSREHDETMADLLRIVPSDTDADADYWFASDPNVSVTDAWGT